MASTRWFANCRSVVPRAERALAALIFSNRPAASEASSPADFFCFELQD